MILNINDQFTITYIFIYISRITLNISQKLKNVFSAVYVKTADEIYSCRCSTTHRDRRKSQSQPALCSTPQFPLLGNVATIQLLHR